MWDTRFIYTPYDIMKKKGITDSERLLFGMVHGYPDGEFHCSNEYLAEFFHVSERTIQTRISNLINNKMLFRKDIYGPDGQIGRILTVNTKY